jgi:hypothetical protein
MLWLGLAWIPRLKLGFSRLRLGKMSGPRLGQIVLGLGSGRSFAQSKFYYPSQTSLHIYNLAISIYLKQMEARKPPTSRRETRWW